MGKSKKIDINKMSQKTGVPVFKIKEALGLELNTSGFNFSIKNEEDAQKLFEEIKKEKNVLQVSIFTEKNPPKKSKKFLEFEEISEAELKALYLWISLIEKVEGVVNAFYEAKNEKKAQQLAYEKWNQLSIRDVKLVDTIKEVQECFYNTLEGSPAEEFCLEKLNRLLKEEIYLDETFEELQETYFKILQDPHNEQRKEPIEAKKSLIKKLIDFARTEEKAQWVYIESSFDIELEDLALKNLITFFQ